MPAFSDSILRARDAVLACAVAATLSAPAPMRAAENLATWAHSSDLYFDTSPNGANTANLVQDFPVLIRLRAANFNFAQAMKKGQDLRFAKPNGIPLAYEIDRWDSAGKAAEIWVRMDSVAGNYQGVFARMYWGKPAAPDSSDGDAVFNRSIGFEDVWHLGNAGVQGRPNAVSGKPVAVPVNFDNDEIREGMVGPCDSLDGSSGDHLTLGDGYTEFSGAITISVWANPSRNSVWGRLIDMGNGAGLDNIYFARRDNSQDLTFSTWAAGLKQSEIIAPGVLMPNQWGLYAVTVWGRTAKIYRNGALVAAEELATPVSNLRRAYNYIGRSNWAGDEFFAGKLDEVQLSSVARGSDWIKLAYANQRAAQNLVYYSPPPIFCAVQKFSAPADTSMPEGSSIELSGVADCATGYQWSALSGPAPRILDPEVKVLQVALPRVTKDTAILYRFTANYGISAKTKDVLIQLKEAIPDPAFTLGNAQWNGKDSLLLKPVIANLAEIKASREPNLVWSWSTSIVPADTAWRKDGLMLKQAPIDGGLKVTLCLHNGGSAFCRTATVTVNHALSLAARAKAERPAIRAARDARGRLEADLRSLRAFPAGPRR